MTSQGERDLFVASRRNRRVHFPRRADVETMFGERMQMDVAILGTGLKTWNFALQKPRQSHFALILIDIFSKKVFIRSMKARSAEESIRCLKDMFKDFQPPFPPFPNIIESDKGGEFTGQKVKDFFEKLGIQHDFQLGTHKNEIVERAIKTFKAIVVPYLEHAHPQATWDEAVAFAERKMNQTVNTSIGFKPNQVPNHWSEVLDKTVAKMNETSLPQYEKLTEKLTKGGKVLDSNRKLGIGDWVLVVNDKSSTEKATVRNYTYKPWQIQSISVGRKPFLYTLRGRLGEKAPREYYAIELLRLAKVPPKGNVPLAGIVDSKLDSSNKKQWKVRMVDHEPAYDKWVSSVKEPLPPSDKRDIPRGAKPIKRKAERQGGRAKAYKRKKNDA